MLALGLSGPAEGDGVWAVGVAGLPRALGEVVRLKLGDGILTEPGWLLLALPPPECDAERWWSACGLMVYCQR